MYLFTKRAVIENPFLVVVTDRIVRWREYRNIYCLRAHRAKNIYAVTVNDGVDATALGLRKGKFGGRHETHYTLIIKDKP